jgi:endo-1,4-beta-xylanase
VARWLRDRGIAAFVLKYRLASEEGSAYTVDRDALSDMQRAVRLVRSNARSWGIDTSRVGVMGFSAGGELAALASMRFGAMPHPVDSIDALSARPAFQALIYPGRSERFVATKLHMYATAGHGFGMRESNRSASAGWPGRLVEWLTDIGMLTAR